MVFEELLLGGFVGVAKSSFPLDLGVVSVDCKVSGKPQTIVSF